MAGITPAISDFGVTLAKASFSLGGRTGFLESHEMAIKDFDLLG